MYQLSLRTGQRYMAKWRMFFLPLIGFHTHTCPWMSYTAVLHKFFLDFLFFNILSTTKINEPTLTIYSDSCRSIVYRVNKSERESHWSTIPQVQLYYYYYYYYRVFSLLCVCVCISILHKHIFCGLSHSLSASTKGGGQVSGAIDKRAEWTASVCVPELFIIIIKK